MDIKHITSDSLRHLLSLTDKKEQLIKAVSEVEDQIARTLKGAATTTVEVAEAVTPFKKARKAPKAKGTKSGGLKERILALLEEAGDEGVRVKDLAVQLAKKPGNIAVWFSTTGKKLVTKVEPGRYAVKGSAKPASKPVAKPAAKPSPAPSPKKPSKPAKKKSGITPEGRAKLSASLKARWAARKAGKPAKKGFKLAKKA
jgi:hypothetical protein